MTTPEVNFAKSSFDMFKLISKNFFLADGEIIIRVLYEELAALFFADI